MADKSKTVYHKIEILMDGRHFALYVDTNDDFAKSMVQKHNPKDSIELKNLINKELGREAAMLG